MCEEVSKTGDEMSSWLDSVEHNSLCTAPEEPLLGG